MNQYYYNTHEVNDDVDMIVNRQPKMVQTVRRLIIHTSKAHKRSISIIRRGSNKAQEHLHGLCLLSSTLLPVFGYPTKEEELPPPLWRSQRTQWGACREAHKAV